MALIVSAVVVPTRLLVVQTQVPPVPLATDVQKAIGTVFAVNVTVPVGAIGLSELAPALREAVKVTD